MVQKRRKVVYHIKSGHSYGSGNSSLLSRTQALETYRQRIRKISSANVHLAKELCAEREKNRRHGETGQRYSQVSTLHLPRIKAWLEENLTYNRKLGDNLVRALELMNRILNPRARLSLTVGLETKRKEDTPRPRLNPPGPSGHQHFTMPRIPEVQVEDDADDGACRGRSDDLDLLPRRSTANVTQRKKRSSGDCDIKRTSGTPSELPVAHPDKQAAVWRSTSNDAPVPVTRRSSGNGGQLSQPPVSTGQQVPQRKKRSSEKGAIKRTSGTPSELPVAHPDKEAAVRRSASNGAPVPVTRRSSGSDGPRSQLPVPTGQQATQRKVSGPSESKERTRSSNGHAVPPRRDITTPTTECPTAESAPLQGAGSQSALEASYQARPRPQAVVRAMPSRLQTYGAASVKPRISASKFLQCLSAYNRQDDGNEMRADHEKGVREDIDQQGQDHATGTTALPVPSTVVEDGSRPAPDVCPDRTGKQDPTPETECAASAHVEEPHPPEQDTSRTSLPGIEVETLTSVRTEKPKPARHDEMPSKRRPRRSSRGQFLGGLGNNKMKEVDWEKFQEAVGVLSVITNTVSPKHRHPVVRFFEAAIESTAAGRKQKAPCPSANDHTSTSAEAVVEQANKENERPRTSSEGACDPVEQQQRSKRRTSRTISYKEPYLNTKLRRP